MDSKLRRLMRDHGYRCDETFLRRADVYLRKNRTNTVFKVVLPETYSDASPEDWIETVHAALWPAVNDVVMRFSDRLQEHVGSQ